MENYYKEVRRISADDLRQLCIEKNWCTRASNNEYEHLLYLVKNTGNLSTSAIIDIAGWISIQSYGNEDNIEWIAYEIARTSYTFFEKL